MSKKAVGINKLKDDQTFLDTLKDVKRQEDELAIPKLNTSHAQAVITFLTTDNGGRIGPVRSGYRGQFFYDGKDWDAVQRYEGIEWVYPGQTVKTHLWFLSPEAHYANLYVGKSFEIREGGKVVAHGHITATNK